jgi:L-malate glycosyltransferase
MSALPMAGAKPWTRVGAVQGWLVRLILRRGLWAYRRVVAMAARFGPAPRVWAPGECEVLLTGTFYADNWVRSHVLPLAAARACARVRIVSSTPLLPMPRVEVVLPPRWLARSLGTVPARLLTFAWTALRTRPHLVGGFHLLLNGLLAALVARLSGARALYFCVGGPAEVLDGGLWAENRLFGRIGRADSGIERQLLQAIDGFDAVVTMGSGAVRFLRDKGLGVRCEVIAGGVDPARFGGPAGPADLDLVLVARLVPIKAVDLFLRAVSGVAQRMPSVSAAVVGDGPLRPSLEELARALDLGERVQFVGQQADVASWLRRARLFVLTSESEGLPLSVMEAMSCGLPVVAPRVGELPELVEDGVNGFLVRERSPEAFTEKMLALLSEPERRAAFAAEAARAAARHRPEVVSAAWDALLSSPALAGGGREGPECTR